jgi:hypothetical protein
LARRPLPGIRQKGFGCEIEACCAAKATTGETRKSRKLEQYAAFSRQSKQLEPQYAASGGIFTALEGIFAAREDPEEVCSR